MIQANLWRGLAGGLLLALAGCGGASVGPRVGVIPAGLLLAGEVLPAPPREPAEGECWGDETIPAVIETVTEQAEVSPGVYQTKTRQRIVSERQDVWFRVPCEGVEDPGFVGTLQRALKVRGLYRGGISGVMDGETTVAIRRYQAPQGLDSGVLSLAAARQLGLVAFDRADLK